jgi:SpoVK/Ycf46/Vps4 family AAA+-type ATPase
MVLRQVGPGGPVRAQLSDADVAKIVHKTAGYSGSDMKNLVQEACQGPVREAVVAHGAAGAPPLLAAGDARLPHACARAQPREP